MDGRGYGGYKQIKGAWGDGRVELRVDHVQGDPFATPSRLRLRIPVEIHQIPVSMRQEGPRRLATCDFLLRAFHRVTREASSRSGSGKSGLVIVDTPGAEVLSRSGCAFVDDMLEVRFRVGLPARGRKVLGHAAARLLCDDLPDAATGLYWPNLDQRAALRWAEVVEDHAHLRGQLARRGLVSFIADGAILPRASGISAAPMANAVPFAAPEVLRVELPTLHHGVLTGMGIPRGITLITGGGFHGKTTLLAAIEEGVYPHIPGDGREWVATLPEAVKVRSEDGRSVTGVDLRPFIHDLPLGRDTAAFTTPDASGSTSLASAILEALELGARALLLDEDTSATNMLIRDARMQALVARETITPLIDRVRALHDEHGVSTILVVGGSGDYLEVADTVILMQDYLPREVSDRARAVVRTHPTGRVVDPGGAPVRVTPRRPRIRSFDPSRGHESRVRARGLRELQYGDQTIDLSALDQLVDDSQARAIGVLLEWLGANGVQGHTVTELVDDALAVAEHRGLYGIAPLPELAEVRRFELAGALNRLRSLEVASTRETERR